MRIVLIVLLLAGAVFLWWWLRKRSNDLDLGMTRVDWAVVVVPLVVAVILSGFEVRWQVRQAEASEMVRTVSGVESADASCQRWSDAWREIRTYKGWVYAGDDTAHLLHSTCQDLFTWLDGDGYTDDLDQIVAVQIVSHEAAHVAGEFNEAVAECQSMRNLPSLFIARGVDEVTAHQYAERYRVEVHPRLQSQYLGGVC